MQLRSKKAAPAAKAGVVISGKWWVVGGQQKRLGEIQAFFALNFRRLSFRPLRSYGFFYEELTQVDFRNLR